MPLPLSSKGKKRAIASGIVLAGLVGAIYMLDDVPFPRADAESRPRAPASVFSEPEVILPRTAPEARAVALIEAGKSDEARRLIETSLPSAQEPS
ncbi:MAG TPA: hypothetical protein VMF89_37515, partial [Polyangiales bacterium]|nr:hypothetical protein [Polyangiales bacterium]